MNEANTESFNFKPLTLYSFFPKNKRFKISKKNTNVILKNNNDNTKPNTNNEKINKTSNSNSKKEYIPTSGKNLKFNNIASSTSTNFYNNHQNIDGVDRKYSFNYNNNNNYKYNLRSSGQKKNKQKDQKNRKQERIKSTGDSYLQHIQNFGNKEINEKFLEQFLENYDSKLQRNMKDMKANYSNSNNYYNSNLKLSKNNVAKSLKNSNNKLVKNDNDYINSVRFKNVIRLNNEKIYNYLPYLNSSSKDTKISPKLQKKLLVYGSYNINTINAGFNPANGSAGFKNMQKYYNNMHTLTKDNIINNKNSKKNSNFYLSSKQVLKSFNNNNNNTTNSNISNTGNNNIIFSNIGSIGSINNGGYNGYDDDNSKKYNYYEEISRTNTAGAGRANNFDYNVYLKKSNKKLFDTVKNEAFKINDIEINKENKENKEKDKIIRNFNFLKEDKSKNNEKVKDKDNEKDIKIENNTKARALSTVPHKKRSKNTTKNIINIDCNINNNNNNNPNKEKLISDENAIIQNDREHRKHNHNNNNKETKKDKLAKYEIGESLGKGAYATVKLVTNKITKEKFAMKIYEKEKLNSNSKKNCVYKEIQILKRLKHKNIAKLIEVISTEKQILIVQELIEGISLREYYNNEIRNQKGISIHKENVFRIIFKQIFEAMDYIHKLGMAHRDIKLENILIKKNYEIKIIDFGFGMYNPENKLQKFFCGTPNYMPPEIAEKKPYIGQLADMWSLGILVYKIFCADFPFKGKDEKELYKAIKTGKFTMASYTPEYAKKIICSLIVLNPNKRMTCEEVLNSDWLKDK
jgi:hypothetical protein